VTGRAQHALERCDGRVGSAALEPRDDGLLQPCARGELCLREARRVAGASDQLGRGGAIALCHSTNAI
jgi:hypothetical protein